MRNDINADLLSNIEISEEMKQDIYNGVKVGKRTSDFRFRHSGALLAALIIGAVTLTGAGASAAAIITFSSRMEEMPVEEKQAYKQEVKKDIFISTDEGFSRELTNDEIKRVIKLERDYYDRHVFPENEMAHYEKTAERAADELAYVVEDNIVYLPEKMTDEQLLQYIDHDAKKRYVNIEQLKKDGVEPGVGMALESTKVAEGSPESEALKVAKKEIKKQYGVEITDKWIALIDYFSNDEIPENQKTERDIPLYHMYFYQLGTGYGDRYDASVSAEDMKLMSLNKFGFSEE